MAQPDVRPAAPKPEKSTKLNPVPFVVDTNNYSKPRAWKAKSNSANPNRVTIAAGSITFRVAGSEITFSRDVQIRIDGPNAEPASYLDVPFDGKMFGSQPLFGSDTDTGAADLRRFWETATADY